ncbi:putative oxidoreductase (short-chain dehydrogenase family) [Natrialba magadii ATCC 43099]|uniref:Oxidoreductase (Short-chain dehydrogenase family) n=1 Tax=Natrialba magadii (strain ATCC 43099 / DSM 3394 / CCM 3739 / CIP 104546 / IAM 13178 / JCM 8861 / NBRC 102185 / NCIMB 2190 / MS3) TaxID=547559 RepID=D3SY97_NATMM|nr:SDR family NAD(P)-dependent oxidoreductase [Natrialba magadii]ADD06068.1 putative oxidoreductase (short-chain dehydrogenase family) [Natrialba magadii ATCC 43099]ELY30935.1 short-chain dehydrogenase/reductase SDR [Natrialba magadii ATCC 43099]
MDDHTLENRTVLVTGSARGVGRELLVATAERGADTAVHYHTSADAARDVAETASERGPGDVMTVQGDVTDPDSVDGLFSAVESELGAVDVLVNNVGDFAPSHWDELEFETWNRVLETNLNGTYLCSKRALETMRDGDRDEDDYGRIVNIGYASSEKGLVSPVNFPYFVAKAGVLMFTRMLAADTQDDGVTVNAISPYVVENSDEFPEELPRDRPASFDDLMQPLLFFLDPDSGYISGENIEVDGGWLPEHV